MIDLDSQLKEEKMFANEQWNRLKYNASLNPIPHQMIGNVIDLCNEVDNRILNAEKQELL